MKKLSTILIALLVSIVTVSAQTVSVITPQAGEKWWGLFAGNSPSQPFVKPFEVQTGKMNRGSFATPYMVSSTGRYVRSGEELKIIFDGSRFEISSEGGHVDGVRGGKSLRQAYLSMHHRNFKDTGRAPSQELFTNLIYETQTDFGFLQTAEDILAYAHRLLDEGFPPGIMVLSEGWSSSVGYPGGYDFDKSAYPDPAMFVEQMHRMGFKVMLTITPYVPAWGRYFAAQHKNGMLVGEHGTEHDGEPLVISMAKGFCGVLDFSNPLIGDGLRQSLAELRASYKVDGFRFDCTELIEQSENRDGFVHNYLEAVQQIGAKFALVEFMPGVAGFQSDYVSALRTEGRSEVEYLTDLLNVGLAAGPFTTILPNRSEVNHTCDRSTVRYALMQAMQPVARVPFAPWKYGFAADELQRVVVFRASLSKYMEKMFAESVKTVEPIIRPLEYHFAKAGFADCGEQYMLGERYLVAPAIEQSPKRLVRLPKGTWRDMEGKRHKGPLLLEVENDGYKMVYFELDSF